MKQTNEEKRIHLFGVKSKGSSYHFISNFHNHRSIFIRCDIYLISANKLDNAWAHHKVKYPTLYSYHRFLFFDHFLSTKLIDFDKIDIL